MNNALDIALTRIRATIPQEILAYAFTSRELREETFPIDQLIIEKVIRPRVLKDMNISGGYQKKIMLRREYIEPMERNIDDARQNTGRFAIYRIPPREREGRAITEVISLEYYGPYNGHLPTLYGYPAGANVPSLAGHILDSHTLASTPPKPTVILMAGDLVKLIPSQLSNINWMMNCRLAFDENFNNLNTSAISPFADLCVLAVQAYIYNLTMVTLDKAFISGGYAIGAFKLQIDQYQDANQRYLEQLKVVDGAMALDPARLNALLPFIV